jgi:uncharacterized sporulation protein YeaH/YhbH (DUF444 family)
MSRRIQEDHKEFRDVVAGNVDAQVKKFIKNGKLVGWRPKGGKFVINLPRIDLPDFRYGRDSKGWARGEGKEGDVVGKDPKKGKGKKGEAGTDPGDTMPVGIDLKFILDAMKDELELPNLQPKSESNIYEERFVYNGIRKTGPESLRHNRRTMKQAMLRMIQTGEYSDKNPVIVPIQEDKRYKSWNVKKYPKSNAAIFFARDWSGSMDDRKCEIVMNTCFWIDQWIRQFYKRTESIYIGHDTEAKEIDQENFYKQRYGGGTMCSSAFTLIKEKMEFSFSPKEWNIYVFYFSDGENYDSDNAKAVDLLKDLQKDANLFGYGQILSWAEDTSLLHKIKEEFGDKENVRWYDYKRGGEEDHPDSNHGTGDNSSPEFEIIKKFLGKKNGVPGLNRI